MDSDAGAASLNPTIVYVMVKHYPNNIGTAGGGTPGPTIIQPQQQHQQIVPNNKQKIGVVALPLTSIRSMDMLNLASLEISRTQNIFCNL
jgi:hypothetical protein